MMTLDVLCHEVGHGVTSWKGGNMEYWGESGAMNEAYSDILGNSLTQYKRTCNSNTVRNENNSYSVLPAIDDQNNCSW